MIELLRRVCEVEPGRLAIIDDDRAHTYAELTDQAEAMADALVDRGITRFAIASSDAAVVTSLLAAAALVGTDACQYPPDDSEAEIESMLQRFSHDTLVTDKAHLASLPGATTPRELVGPGGSATKREIGPGPRPLLILTTGTTGLPRGARHDWNRVLRRPLRSHPDTPEPQRWMLAYGLHQFAGLQVLTHVTAVGGTLAAPSERRPKDALAAMRQHAVRYVSATPTWYRFLLAELASDGGPPPPLVQLTLGGEAAPEHLLARLKEVFPGAAVSHVYAANEIGATGSVRDGTSGLHTSILDRDDSADIQLKVEDGELYARSRVGMLGYYGEEERDDDSWWPTGDMVEIIGDRVFFRGRSSEVINVGGVKVHPLPIEELASSVPGVAHARVFGRSSAVMGAIVAVELVLDRGADEESVREAIREACAELPPAMHPRSIRVVDQVTMRGGKVARRSAP